MTTIVLSSPRISRATDHLPDLRVEPLNLGVIVEQVVRTPACREGTAGRHVLRPQPRLAPVPASYGRCGSGPPNQKQNGSPGAACEELLERFNRGPAGLRCGRPKRTRPPTLPLKPTR